MCSGVSQHVDDRKGPGDISDVVPAIFQMFCLSVGLLRSFARRGPSIP